MVWAKYSLFKYLDPLGVGPVIMHGGRYFIFGYPYPPFLEIPLVWIQKCWVLDSTVAEVVGRF